MSENKLFLTFNLRKRYSDKPFFCRTRQKLNHISLKYDWAFAEFEKKSLIHLFCYVSSVKFVDLMIGLLGDVFNFFRFGIKFFEFA